MAPRLLLVLGLAIVLGLSLSACGGTGGSASATPTNDQVLLAVAQALVAKHGWDPKDVKIEFDHIEDERYANGAVRDDKEGGGGLWFAELVDGKWQIVWDGNGDIDCPSLQPYPDFPASMVPQCYNPSDGSTTQR
jgi:hypothetical protein